MPAYLVNVWGEKEVLRTPERPHSVCVGDCGRWLQASGVDSGLWAERLVDTLCLWPGFFALVWGGLG